jgi:putative acetyltransferase
MIRKYRDSDIEVLLDVWFQANAVAHPFQSEVFVDKERSKIRDIYIHHTETWVFSGTDGLTGFISMMGNEVAAIFVLPSKHGQGIGTKLMNVVAKLHDVLEVEVFTENGNGLEFYKAYGFKAYKTHMHEDTGHELTRMKYTTKMQ